MKINKYDHVVACVSSRGRVTHERWIVMGPPTKEGDFYMEVIIIKK